MGGKISTQQLVDICNNVLQQSIKEAVTDNETAVGNITTSTQEMKVNIDGADCKDLDIRQTLKANSKIISQISSSTSADMKSEMNNELQNSIEQAAKAAMGFMAMGNIDSNNTTRIVNRVQQISQSVMSTSNLNSIFNQVVAKQNMEITLKNIKGEACKISQDVMVDMFTQAVVENLANAIMSDTMINKIVNSVSQKSDSTIRGLDDALKAGAMLALAMAAMFIAMAMMKGGMGGGGGSKAKIIIAIIIILIVLVAIYFILAWFYRWWPFKLKDENWGCEKDADGLYTGKCTKYDNADDGPYKLEEDCNKDAPKRCINGYQFKEDNSACEKVRGIGVYDTAEQCEKERKDSFIWTCDLKDDATPTGGIKQYLKTDAPKTYYIRDKKNILWSSDEQAMNALKSEACARRWFWDRSAEKCIETTRGSIIDGMDNIVKYRSEDMCKSKKGDPPTPVWGCKVGSDGYIVEGEIQEYDPYKVPPGLLPNQKNDSEEEMKKVKDNCKNYYYKTKDDNRCIKTPLSKTIDIDEKKIEGLYKDDNCTSRMSGFDLVCSIQ